MLNKISWEQFLIAIAILSVAYYMGVFFWFYKAEWLAILQGKPLKTSAGKATQEEKPELFKATEKAISVLTTALQEVKMRGANKAEVIATARGVLQKYSYLKGTAYAVAVNHFIIRETSKSIPLLEEEVKELWE